MQIRLKDYPDAVAALRPRAQLWKVPIVLIAALVGQILATVGLFAGAAAFVGDPSVIPDPSLGDLPPVAIVLFLATFLGAAIAVILAVRLLHGMRLADLFGPERRFNTRHFRQGLSVVAVVAAIGIALTFLVDPPVANQPFGSWIYWVLPTLAVLLIQITTEELVFRGYLQPTLAARFRSPLIWLFLPAILFGSLHYQPGTYGPNAWLVVLAAAMMGLVTGHVTARTGNISAALGLHFANNITGLLLVATPGDLDALSLYLNAVDLADIPATRASLIANIATILIAYLVYLGVLWRRDRRLH